MTAAHVLDMLRNRLAPHRRFGVAMSAEDVAALMTVLDDLVDAARTGNGELARLAAVRLRAVRMRDLAAPMGSLAELLGTANAENVVLWPVVPRPVPAEART